MEDIKRIVGESKSFGDFFRAIGKKSYSGQQKLKYQKLLKDNNIDFDHFETNGASKLRKYEKITKTCPQCGESFETQNGHPKELSTCSRQCSNIYFSSKRTTEEAKSNISKGLLKYFGNTAKTKTTNQTNKKPPSVRKIINCAVCQKSFKQKEDRHKCCSKLCGQVLQFGFAPLSKIEVIDGILELEKTGDWQQRKAPTKLLSGAKTHFGSWNKAIKAAGLKPNDSKFKRVRIKCIDGDIVDSLSERTIDEFLFNKNIAHTIHKKYPNSNKRYDFYLPDFDTYVEYFGLTGDEAYDIATEEKIKFCEDNDLKLIAIYPTDIYPTHNLEQIFKDII